jgi:hypothetical protein
MSDDNYNQRSTMLQPAVLISPDLTNAAIMMLWRQMVMTCLAMGVLAIEKKKYDQGWHVNY